MIRVNETIVPPTDALSGDLHDVLRSGTLTNNGPRVQALEEALRDRTAAMHAFTTCHGTLALHLVYTALRDRTGLGEVIVPAFTCSATISSMVWEGFHPVIVDVDPETFCIDPDAVRAAITPDTVGLCGVHVFGTACDVEALEVIAHEHGLFVVYDGAHAMGTLWDGRSVLTRGTASMVSLHAYKIVSSVEGGALFCEDADLFEQFRRLRYFGKDRSNLEVVLGTNAKMSELNAVYGIHSLARLDAELNARASIARVYDEAFMSQADVRLQQVDQRVRPNRSYYAVVLRDARTRERVIRSCLDRGIELRAYFTPSLSDLRFYGATVHATAASDDLADRVVCLPIHGRLGSQDVERVKESILEAL